MGTAFQKGSQKYTGAKLGLFPKDALTT